MALVTKSFSDIITFTRASTATYFDSAGVLTSASNNIPRFDYNPATLAARGLLIEEQRTNSIRNNTMQGAVAGTPGTLPTNWNGEWGGPALGLSNSVTAVATVAGISTISYRANGTTTSGGATVLQFENSNQIAASPSQSWSGSCYLALVAGSLANLATFSLTIREYDSGGLFLRQTLQSITGITSSTSRVTVTATTGASTAFVSLGLRPEFVTATANDFTVRIGLPQLEQGAFATSVIPTTTTALTRSADVASVNTLSPWYNATEGTLFAEVGIVQAPVSGTVHVASSLNDATLNNRITTAFGSTFVASMLRNTSGAGLISTSASNAASIGVAKVAVGFSTGASLSLNGGTVATNASYATPTVTQLQLGAQLAASYANGYLRRITYYPRRLSNAELQAITA